MNNYNYGIPISDLVVFEFLCRWYTMVHKNGSVAKFWDFCKQNGFQGLLRIWPRPTLVAWKLIASYAGFEVAL